MLASMAKVDPQKLGALVDKHAKKKAPPKKPGGGGPPPPSQHAKDEADHEGGGETAEHEQGEHDAGKDAEIAEQQASRIANGNGDDELHDLAHDVDPESDEVPEFALDEDIWHRAHDAVEQLHDVEEDDRIAVLVHTYEALGGEIAGHGDTGGGDNDNDGSDDDASGGDHGGPDGFE